METLKALLETKKAEYLSALQALVAIDTECIGHGIDGGKEKPGMEYIMSWLEKLQADEITVDQMENDVILQAIREHDEGNPDHVYDDRFNVYGTFKGSESATHRSILFNGHMDTMPAGNEALWTHGAWNPVVADGKLYGLGTADMKSGVIAPLLAVDLLKSAGRMPKGDVKLITVVDEEGGGNGSIQAAMRGVTADAAVVCEPTDRGLILAHMGFVFYDIRTTGHAVHSGKKFAGVSAIDKMLKIMAALHDLEHDWLYRYKHDLLPSPNINVGEIRGGEAGSTVPAECMIRICVHYLPEQMTKTQVTEAIERAIHYVEAGDPWMQEHPTEISIYQAGGGFEMDLDHAVVGAFQQAHRKVTGTDVEIIGSPAGCDSRTWRNIAGIPTMQFGPGGIDQCHAIDEYIEIADFWHAILMYATLIDEWCNQER